VRLWAGTWGPVILLLLANLIVGLLLVADYGQSTDEEPNLVFARATLASYRHPDTPYRDPAREDKGPFYLMVWLAAGEALGRMVPGWLFADGRHFVNFLTFQMALVSIYALALRFTRPWLALTAVLLFETQPVLFGHAFINQKDIPFMAFFAATLALGIAMVDRFTSGMEHAAEAGKIRRPRSASWDILRQGWAADRPRAVRVAALGAALVFIVPSARLLLHAPLQTALDRTIRAAYVGASWEPINDLFSRVAQNVATVPPEAYVLRAVRLTNLATVGVSLVMLLVAIVVVTTRWPTARRAFWPAVASDLRQGAGLRPPWVLIPASIILGMGIAVRSTTLFAASLVVLYALVRAGPRMALVLTLYGVGAMLVAYVFWPQLWGSPAAMIAGSLDRTFQFPEPHRTLFEGVVLLSNNMPPTYLPHVLSIQLTLPALALILPGVVLMARSAFGSGARAALAWVLILWFIMPFLAVVILRVPIYNYSRHVLFIFPPMFVAAATALDRAMHLIQPPRWAGSLLAVALLLPGLVAIARLHPYEYGYFNELVGGVRGVRGRFIPDYWCTSLREAMEYVNGHAPSSAGIAVTGPESNAIAFAREDLRVRDDAEMLRDSAFQPWAILACNLPTIDPTFFPEAPVLLTVEREGVPLAVLKLLATPTPSTPP
jgi:hypothetical protein